jgi:hypothetical protein
LTTLLEKQRIAFCWFSACLRFLNFEAMFIDAVSENHLQTSENTKSWQIKLAFRSKKI